MLLLCNKVPYPAKDGSSIAIKSMTEGLLVNDAKVHLLSLNTRKHYRSEKDYLEHLPDGLVFEKVDVNTDIHPWGAFLNIISGKAYHVSRFLQKDYSLRLKETLRNNHFDIIQLEGLSMAVYIPLIRKYSTASIVLRAHNIEFKIWERHTKHEPSFWKRQYLNLQTKRLKKFEKQSFKAVEAALFITKRDQKLYREWGGQTISLVAPCGLDLKAYRPIKNEDEPSFDVVHLASLDWLPNEQGALWFLEEVWPLILEARPNTRLAFGGRHMSKAIIEKASDLVWLYPEVKDAKEFISRAKIAIVPLLAGSGMRIKLLEYLAWGKAVVSTPLGAEGIEVKNGKEMLLADDAESFAAGVVYLLDDQESREAMQRAARRFFETHFNNQKLGQEILQFYATLLWPYSGKFSFGLV